jgi:3-methylcrotonyl-CoA carboxylase alpha subunit
MKRDMALIGTGTLHPVSVLHHNGVARIRIGEQERAATLRPVADGEYRLTLDGKNHRVWLVTHGETVFVHAFGRSWELKLIDPIEGAAGHGGADANVASAPMPGMVVALHVAPGDRVHKGQTLMTIESMKLQTPIDAWREGTVKAVQLNEGDRFERGAALVSLTDEED